MKDMKPCPFCGKPARLEHVDSHCIANGGRNRRRMMSEAKSEASALTPLLADFPDIAGEMISLAIKAGRRASYDLKHACGHIQDAEVSEMFYERATMWLRIFDMDSGLKDYRHSLHDEIARLEMVVARKQRLLKDHGIDDPDDLPF